MSKEKTDNIQLPHKYTECYHCQKRQVGCHSHCAAYLAFRNQKEAEANARERLIKESNDVTAVFAKRQKDNERARRRKRR